MTEPTDKEREVWERRRREDERINKELRIPPASPQVGEPFSVNKTVGPTSEERDPEKLKSETTMTLQGRAASPSFWRIAWAVTMGILMAESIIGLLGALGLTLAAVAG